MLWSLGLKVGLQSWHLNNIYALEALVPKTCLNCTPELVLWKICPCPQSLISRLISFSNCFLGFSLFCLLASDIIVVHQNEAAPYVCELCQKQGKAVRSMQLIENGESKTPSPGVKFQDFSSDPILLPQMPNGDGKVCGPYRSNQPCSHINTVKF